MVTILTTLGIVAVCVGALLWLGRGSLFDDDSDYEATKSETFLQIEQNIKKMNSEPWVSSANYEDIRRSIEDKKALKDREKDALKSELAHTYAEQLVRTGRKILDSGCAAANAHTTLNGIAAEYRRREADGFGGYTPDNKDAFFAAYDKHQKQMAFAVSSAYTVGVSTPLDSYNSAYDSQKRSEAGSIRAQNPKCRFVLEKTSDANLNRILSARKDNYFLALVRKFCSSCEWSRSTKNELISRLSGKAQLANRVREHWDNCQAQAPAE